MAYDFDTPLPLRDIHTSKYGGMAKSFGTNDPDIIPMWVADMDFVAPKPVVEAIRAEADVGYFGYFGPVNEISQAFCEWVERRQNWTMKPEWVRFTHGVISGYADALELATERGDGVIVFSPVYHAFYRQIEAMGREVVESELVFRDGEHHMDLGALEASLTGREKVVTFCSPHNPGGRIWSEAEIKELAAFCARNNLLLISDEIHMDLTFPGNQAIPTAIAAPECLDRLIVLTAISKAFNIAGGETGMAIIPDDGMRKEMDHIILDRESSPNRFAMVMIKAACREGDEWMDELRAYIAENFRIFADRIGAIPGVSVVEMNATYLVWADFSGLGMSDAELLKRCVNGAKVAPSPGPQFGAGGEGHLRFNVALPRPTLMTAIERLEQAFGDVQ